MKLPASKRSAKVLAGSAVAAGAGALAVAGALAAPASAHTAHTTAATPFHVTQIANGAKLKHTFSAKGASHTAALTNPDDISQLGDRVFLTFQNGVGPQGEAATDGNLDSTVVEFTLSGHEVAQWDIVGKCDGLTADPVTGKVIATVNEDAHSSLYAISPRSGAVTHYSYNEALPHNGGTDSIAVYHGKLYISASAPGTTGGTAPSATFPAVYVVTLSPSTKVATVKPLFGDEAPAFQANGSAEGKTVDLALTDPDSSEVVPWDAPKYAGDFMLDSQGDQELIFEKGGQLAALHLPASVDDSAWASWHGALYVTDATNDTLDTVTGAFTPGTMYSSVTPCDSSSAPATCPGPGFPANYLAETNMTTGALTPVPLTGATLRTQSMIFVSR